MTMDQKMLTIEKSTKHSVHGHISVIPYHSWEKGSVEYAISLIRRFLPKKTDFAIISPSQLKTIENLLNNRPRKCLTFKTPAEVFSSYVALAG